MRGRLACGVIVGCVMASTAQTARASVAPVWSIQPAPEPSGATSTVLSGVSCSSRRACLAVGDYSDRAGRRVPLAERWTGTRWSIERTAVPSAAPASFLFDASCTAPTSCSAVGSTTSPGGTTVPLGERWNGSQWTIEPIPTPAPRRRVSYLGSLSCASREYCAAVGYSGNGTGTSGAALVERWNGVRWSVQRTPRPARATASFLNAVSCISSHSCTAVGFFKTRAGVAKTLDERWDGSRWSIQPSPTPEAAVAVQLVGASCTVEGPCIAAGYFAIDTGTEVMFAERWGGVRWSIQRTRYPPGATGVQFAAASCTSPGACTAVGFFAAANALDETLAERWNGAHWVIQKTPDPAGAIGSSLTGVSCTSSATCTAVGSYVNAAGTQVTLAERYSAVRPAALHEGLRLLDRAPAQALGATTRRSRAR